MFTILFPKAPLTKQELEALKVIADEAGVDASAAKRDPGMASAARARAAASLAGMSGGMKAMGSMLRL